MNNRKIVLPLVLILALGAASTAMAGGSVFGGVNFPTGGFGDGAKTGWGLGGYWTADLMPIVDIGALVSYNNFASDLDDLPNLDELTDDSLNTWEFHALGQLSFGGSKGFLGLGPGSNSIYGVSSTDFSWQLGLAMQITKVEARLGYHQIPVEDGSMNWVNLSVGLVF